MTQAEKLARRPNFVTIPKEAIISWPFSALRRSEMLQAHGLVTAEVADSVAAFIAANQTFSPSAGAPTPASAPPAQPKR